MSQPRINDRLAKEPWDGLFCLSFKGVPVGGEALFFRGGMVQWDDGNRMPAHGGGDALSEAQGDGKDAAKARLRARLERLFAAAGSRDDELLQSVERLMEEKERLEAESERMRREAARLRARLSASGSGPMSSRLKDALRE